MKRISIVAIGLCFSALQGCATLNEASCTEANWQDIGFNDGAIGERHQLSRHQKACSQHGIAVDANSYNTGRDKGLKAFCTADKGFETGIYGNEYFGVCPEPIAREFETAYVKGLRVKLEQLSIDQKRLNRRVTDNRLVEISAGPYRGQKSITGHLQSRAQSMQHLRIVIQGWIAKWAAT